MNKEEIRQAAQDWDGSGMATPSEEGAFVAGAEWMQERMIEKAAEWLRENIDEDVSVSCGNVIKIISTDEFVEYFTKSMEEEK